jgi:hypothetical protein
MGKELTEAIARAKEADARIAEAQRGASEAGASAKKSSEHAAELDLKTAQLQRDNLELEAQLSPRLFRQQHDAANRLKAFSGFTVLLKYLSDPECKNTAEQIAFVLEAAGWKYTQIAVSLGPQLSLEDLFFVRPGVTVTDPMGGAFGISGVSPGTAVADELNRTGIDAMPTPSLDGPEHTLIIRVGTKLSPDQKRLQQYAEAIMKAAMDHKPIPTPPSSLRPSGSGNRIIFP